MNFQMPPGISNKNITTNLDKNKFSWIEVVLLVVAIILVVIFLLFPKQAQFTESKVQLEKTQEDQKHLSQEIEKLKVLAKQIKSNPDLIESLDEGLPLNGRITRVQILLQTLANNSAVSAVDVSVSPQTDSISAGDSELVQDPFGVKRSIKKINASLNVIGNIDQLVLFLKKLEGSGRILNINSLEISPSQSQQLEMHINLETYYFSK